MDYGQAADECSSVMFVLTLMHFNNPEFAITAIATAIQQDSNLKAHGSLIPLSDYTNVLKEIAKER